MKENRRLHAVHQVTQVMTLTWDVPFYASQGYLVPVDKSVWILMTIQYSCQALSLQVQGWVSSAVLSFSLVAGLVMARYRSIDWWPNYPACVWSPQSLPGVFPPLTSAAIEYPIVCWTSPESVPFAAGRSEEARGALYSCRNPPLSTPPIVHLAVHICL